MTVSMSFVDTSGCCMTGTNRSIDDPAKQCWLWSPEAMNKRRTSCNKKKKSWIISNVKKRGNRSDSYNSWENHPCQWLYHYVLKKKLERETSAVDNKDAVWQPIAFITDTFKVMNTFESLLLVLLDNGWSVLYLTNSAFKKCWEEHTLNSNYRTSISHLTT